MKGIIATICFTVLTLVGCVADPDTATQAQDSAARVEQAVSSTQANEVLPDVKLLTGPMKQLSLSSAAAAPEEGVIVCIKDGNCAACCGGGVCCSGCSGGPITCSQ